MYRNHTGRKAVLCLAVMVLLSGILTGCGGRERSSDLKTGAETMSGAGYMNSSAPGFTPEPAYAPAEDLEYADAEENASKESSSAASGILQHSENVSDKLIYSGSITIQTLDYEKTVESIHARIVNAGGFIQYEDETDGNDTWYYSSSSNKAGTRYAQIQARIPSEQFSSFMDELSQDGQVMNRHVNADNITQTYSDTEASVKAYEIEQERLLDMMDKAETIEDMIAVEARLSEVEAELNSYKTSLASMDRDVEYSTVSISVDEVREYTEEHDDSTFLSRLKETVKDSWSGFLWFMEGLLHLFIRLLPFLIVIGVIGLIVRTVSKKTEQRRMRKREEKAQKKMQKFMERQQKAMQKYGYPQNPAAPGDADEETQDEGADR